MQLIEREEVLGRLAEAYRAACAREGRLLLLAGEAGIGKTSVVSHFARSEARAGRAAWGWCDPLSAPRALAPFHDIMEDLRETSDASFSDAASASDFLPALLNAVRSESRPVLIVVEDAHWADEASLEQELLIVRFLPDRGRMLGGEAVEALQRLNLAADELRRLPLDQRVAPIQDALARYVPEAQRAAVASKLFGDRAGLVFSASTQRRCARRPRTCATSASLSPTRTPGRSSAPTTRCPGSG